MTLKEYKIHKALGTVDYLKIARITKSSKVLSDIFITCIDVNNTNTTTVILAIAMNPCTSLEVLEHIIIRFFTFGGVPLHYSIEITPEIIHNPKITSSVLKQWMSRYPWLSTNSKVRQHLYNLQVIEGVPEKDRIDVVEVVNVVEELYHSNVVRDTSSYYPMKYWTPTSIDGVWYTATYTGS